MRVPVLVIALLLAAGSAVGAPAPLGPPGPLPDAPKSLGPATPAPPSQCPETISATFTPAQWSVILAAMSDQEAPYHATIRARDALADQLAQACVAWRRAQDASALTSHKPRP